MVDAVSLTAELDTLAAFVGLGTTTLVVAFAALGSATMSQVSAAWPTESP